MHIWPTPQAALLPHLQVPPLQLSARIALHAAHAAPGVPQAVAVGEVQAVPVQQPDAQLSTSQMQAPPKQRWPGVHAGPVPQVHAPAVQLSVTIVWQVAQTMPPVPQAVSLDTWHTPPKQQPVGQVVESHPVQEPPWQSSPVLHA